MIFELFDGERTAPIAVEESAYEGVKKIAYKVAEDITRVTNVDEKVLIGNEAEEEISKEKCIILVGTIGKSACLDQLIAEKKIEMAKVEGRREVYLFQIVEAPFEGIEKALVIAGSDKRGTIYGLFHISELLGVSPWVEFGDVVPKGKTEFCLTSSRIWFQKSHPLSIVDFLSMMNGRHSGRGPISIIVGLLLKCMIRYLSFCCV